MRKSLAFVYCCVLSFYYLNFCSSFCHLAKANNYLAGNNNLLAFKELKIAVRQNPYNLTARYYLAGLIMKFKPLEALKLLREIENKSPHFLLTNYFKAIIYDNLGFYRQASEEIRKAERLYPLDEIIQREKKDIIERNKRRKINYER